MINTLISQTLTMQGVPSRTPTIAGCFAAAVAILLGPCTTRVWAQAGKTSETVSLHGAGSTFAAPLYKKWIEEYARCASQRLDFL